MKRREFITLLGGAAAWPVVAWAQQSERVRRIGVLMDTAENNREGLTRITAFRERLEALGWSEGRQIKLDVRWAGGDIERARVYAAELVSLKPDAIFAFANAQLRPLSQDTRSIPIVFVGASDPVGAGYVASFARPGGNVTGFTLFEPSMAGKWVSALKEIAPRLTDVAIMVNPETGMQQGTFYLASFEQAARALMMQPRNVVVRNDREIGTAVAELGGRGSGLVVAPDGFAQAHDELIVRLASQYRVPAVYGPGNYVKVGGLMSYGPDFLEMCRQAGSYVDRILRGEQPADMPIQAPTKFQLGLNLKAARALGLEVPASLLARADEVIE